jgi:hypothetical protein
VEALGLIAFMFFAILAIVLIGKVFANVGRGVTGGAREFIKVVDDDKDKELRATGKSEAYVVQHRVVRSTRRVLKSFTWVWLLGMLFSLAFVFLMPPVGIVFFAFFGYLMIRSVMEARAEFGKIAAAVREEEAKLPPQ